ncbi:hypothetical protein [Novosphingobium aquae]|uniref:Alpha-carbonic anhydrase domain-containing protein n=1 Tax=Novosphingobium aquae TaxID=3133435 RepID=A0ABU8SB99_9SPHN
MIRRRLLALAPPALLLTGNAPGHDKPHWSYGGEAGPEKWGELSHDFELCKTGQCNRRSIWARRMSWAISPSRRPTSRGR